MHGLPFRQVWAIDFEFRGTDGGGLPEVVCMVARELGSRRLIRLWKGEFPPNPPFPVDASALFVAFYASAEISCFLALNWPVPVRWLDLYAEFKNETNGQSRPAGSGLLGAMVWHGIPGITKDQKDDMRDLVLRGGPWTTAERADILDYCQSDVDALGPLLERMLPAIRLRRYGLAQALLRGRFMCASAAMERNGVPMDVPVLGSLRQNWAPLKLDLIRMVDKDFGVFDGTTFKAALFGYLLEDHGITWPRTETGRLKLDADTFRDMTRLHTWLEPLRELRSSLSEMRLAELAVGPDGRNRVMLSAFGSKTGRNQPSNSKFIFGPAKWMRGLIKPEPDRAVAYIDWSSQEAWIAAFLSGDPALVRAVTSGDVYLALARQTGQAPPDATKETHRAVRDRFKVVVLGINYGMGAKTLACQTGMHIIEARSLLDRIARAYPVYTEWAQAMSDTGQLGGHLSTVFGWTLLDGPMTRTTTLRNFPMQANGAEMLRLACCLAIERGVMVCAPVHDAMLIEAAEDEIEDAVSVTRAAMAEASRIVLAGPEIGTDKAIVRFPDRYMDDRGVSMWKLVTGLLPQVSRRVSREGPQPPSASTLPGESPGGESPGRVHGDT